MEVIDAICRRRAVRNFTAEPVAKAQLTRLIEAAVQAPSAVNEQPWVFTVVTDRATLAAVSARAKMHILKTSCAGLVAHHFQTVLSDAKFDIFYGAPALVVISAAKEGPRRSRTALLLPRT